MNGPTDSSLPDGSQNRIFMFVTIQLSDADYASLLNGSSRMQGSIGLVSPTEGNFNAHRRARTKPGTQYMRLPHGKISVSDEDVRMNLRINRDESIVPARAIEAESGLASSFVDFMEECL